MLLCGIVWYFIDRVPPTFGCHLPGSGLGNLTRCFRVLCGIALYLVVLTCIDTVEMILCDWRDIVDVLSEY